MELAAEPSRPWLEVFHLRMSRMSFAHEEQTLVVLRQLSGAVVRFSNLLFLSAKLSNLRAQTSVLSPGSNARSQSRW